MRKLTEAAGFLILFYFAPLTYSVLKAQALMSRVKLSSAGLNISTLGMLLGQIEYRGKYPNTDGHQYICVFNVGSGVLIFLPCLLN